MLNPSARHSLGVGILTRCRITFEGSLGYFGVGLIDGPEVQINGRVGWSVAENMMSGVVVIEAQLPGRWPAPRCAVATSWSRARSAPAPASTRRAAPSS